MSMSIWNSEATCNENIEEVSHYTALLSELYDNGWYGKITQAEVDFFVSYIKDKRTLEIASGTGRISRRLLERECDLYGLEKSKWFFDKLKSNIPTQHWNRFVLWDAMNVPYPVADQIFDCVIVPFSSFTLIHEKCNNLGGNHAFHEFNRLLKPGGYVLINDYRSCAFDHRWLDEKPPPTIKKHQHPVHGQVLEEMQNEFKVVPNRLLSKQIVRHRYTKLVRVEEGKVLEEHVEIVPAWHPEDYPILGNDAGFKYIKGEICDFHDSSSTNHIFCKL
ncbi:MAG: class I SAM-dependent methyltransferase [Candidatus Parabeggiatoa sp.]|nr:class I SAM-dependent methyltransferase [Candidatus Parabeggiatoa sp.]